MQLSTIFVVCRMSSSSRSLASPLASAVRASQRPLATQVARRQVSSTSTSLLQSTGCSSRSPLVPSTRRSIHTSITSRQKSATPPRALAASSDDATLAALDERWRGRLPRFELKADEIDVLHEPEQFFQTLLVSLICMCQEADPSRHLLASSRSRRWPSMVQPAQTRPS